MALLTYLGCGGEPAVAATPCADLLKAPRSYQLALGHKIGTRTIRTRQDWDQLSLGEGLYLLTMLGLQASPRFEKPYSDCLDSLFLPQQPRAGAARCNSLANDPAMFARVFPGESQSTKLAARWRRLSAGPKLYFLARSEKDKDDGSSEDTAFENCLLTYWLK